MIRQPLHHRIAENEIGARIGRPGRDIALDKFAIRQPFARLAQHIRRGVEPDDFGLGKTLDEKLGRIARPAAEIDHKPRPLQRHLREQIARRAGAFVLEFEILAGAPVFHGVRRPDVATLDRFDYALLLAGVSVYVLRSARLLRWSPQAWPGSAAAQNKSSDADTLRGCREYRHGADGSGRRHHAQPAIAVAGPARRGRDRFTLRTILNMTRSSSTSAASRPANSKPCGRGAENADDQRRRYCWRCGGRGPGPARSSLWRKISRPFSRS